MGGKVLAGTGNRGFTARLFPVVDSPCPRDVYIICMYMFTQNTLLDKFASSG